MVKKIFDKLILWGVTKIIVFLLILNSFFNRRRMSHENGVVAKCKITIVPEPKFPANDFFEPGKVFSGRIRHSSTRLYHDASIVARGTAIKFADSDYKSPFDLEMNTGKTTPTWTVYEFLNFFIAQTRGGGARFFRPHFAKKPERSAYARDTLRNLPESFAQLYFYSKFPLYYFAKNGETWYAKFRLVPENRGEETGLLPEGYSRPVWEQDPSENYPADYLRQEYKARLKRQSSITFHLQIQLHKPQKEDTHEVFHASKEWDLETHPWIDLATVTSYEVLPYEKANRIRFDITHHPPILGIIEATSIHDYNSVNYMRSKASMAKKARLLSYRLFGNPPEIKEQTRSQVNPNSI